MAAPATLDRITDFPGLVRYLREQLEWEIPEDAAFGDLTFNWTPSEIGLDLDEPIEITQLRPLRADQRWGIFFLNFPHGKLPVTLMRRILRGLSKRKRASANAADRAAWSKDDLIFVSAVGDADDRRLSFAHFQERGNDLPTLRVIGWDKDDTVRRLSHTDQVLRTKLGWLHGEGLPLNWRDAFTERPRESVRTAKEMAEALAALARDIRDRIKLILPKEKANGDLRQLFEAVKQTLSRDLDTEKFADTYAQTIAYGLLSARINQVRERDEKHEAAQKTGLGTKPALPVITAEAAGQAMPTTNPFLKELFGSFLSAGGRDANGDGLDFDELGIGEVVDLLNAADMEAVLLDFDKHKAGDDPVIHFYEGFLHAYDKALKVQRGVFYTPRPVVSFIVRSVDEALRTEFGLEDGLADVTTWDQFVAAHPDTNVPAGVRGDEPFVKILDPATGTGTFLVEVIDLIHATMTKKWKSAGLDDKARIEAWNAYVPNHLLPRLYGFELMMAPYAVAHMKLGLKLADTGYRFEGVDANGTPARARVFLTNALEPARDLGMELSFMSEALAHEAKAANEAKDTARFTAVVGNPPYSNLSANLTTEALTFVEKYRYVDGIKIKERNMLQFERNINDDYVKFFGLCSSLLTSSGSGVACLISNNVYSWSTSLRGLRRELIKNFAVALVDLHGASQRGLAELAEQGDENVFDIEQPVGICRLIKAHKAAAPASYSELIGGEELKLAILNASTMEALKKERSSARPRFWRLTPDRSPYALEYENYLGLEDAVPLFSEAVKTGRDWLVVDFDPDKVVERMSDISTSDETDEALCERIGLNVKKAWNLPAARQAIAGIQLNQYMHQVHYRAFDSQWVFYHPSWIASSASPVMQHLVGPHRDQNLALMAGRTSRDGRSVMVFCSQGLADKGLLSTLDNVSAFPLWAQPTETDDRWTANLAPELVDGIAKLSKLSPLATPTADPTGRGDLTATFGARDVFDWIYAVFHAPTYRERFADFLRSDFARVPLPGDRALFAALIPLGTKLVALHLLDSVAAPILADPAVRFVNPNGVEVRLDSRKGDERRNAAGRVHVNDACWFETVPASAWEHWIGGYQPAQKWLKDRAAKGGTNKREGRVLTPEDQLHYRRLIVALEETAKVMVEIDKVIAEHGGWPDAFRGMTD